MANAYSTWFETENGKYVSELDSFLTNLVGWYRIATVEDTDADRRYVWMSEGSADDNRPPRLISVRGTPTQIHLEAFLVEEGGFNFSTEAWGTYLGTSNESISNVTDTGRNMVVGSKDRVVLCFQNSSTSRFTVYVGFIDSFYSPVDDPNPVFIRGQQYNYTDWPDLNTARMLRADGTDVGHKLNFNNVAVNEGYPNPRTGEYSFSRPTVYYDGALEFYEVRGRLKGVYYGKADRLAHGSFVTIGNQQHLVTKTTDELEAIIVGPVTDTGLVPTNNGWQNAPNLETDYTYRGMQVDAAVSGTHSLWRFDTGHLDAYVYGSGSALPVPSSYPDETGAHTLTPQNGLTSVASRLREAADFNGSTHYATTSGTAPTAAALKTGWTFECIFKPDTIPTAAARSTLVEYSTAGATATENTLLNISISPAVGDTPDAYNVERGNIEVSWENGVANSVSSISTGDFIQQNRWNYLAVVKSFNGTSYDIDVWHCSFGDFIVPEKRATFTGVNNASSGTNSDWYFGVTEALTSYFDGQLDDTRFTERPLSDAEVLASCTRSML